MANDPERRMVDDVRAVCAEPPVADLLQLARRSVPEELRDHASAELQWLYGLLFFYGEPDAREAAEGLRARFEETGAPWLRPLTPHHTPLELPRPTFRGHAARVLHATFDPTSQGASTESR